MVFKRSSLFFILILSILVLVLWKFSPELVNFAFDKDIIKNNREYISNDSIFNPINSLFSILGFIALIVTILMQINNLKDQRSNSKNIEEAQTRQIMLMKNTALLNCLPTLIEELNKVISTHPEWRPAGKNEIKYPLDIPHHELDSTHTLLKKFINEDSTKYAAKLEEYEEFKEKLDNLEESKKSGKISINDRIWWENWPTWHEKVRRLEIVVRNLKNSLDSKSDLDKKLTLFEKYNLDLKDLYNQTIGVQM